MLIATPFGKLRENNNMLKHSSPLALVNQATKGLVIDQVTNSAGSFDLCTVRITS